MNVRKIANDAIEKILYKQAYTNITINEFFDKYELTKEEKALFSRIVMGTIEKKISIAFYLEPYLRKKQKPWVYVILLSAVYQIVYMDVANHFVVNEAVNLASLKDKKIASFVNAVLRNFLRHSLREIDKNKYDEIQYLSLKYSYPTWLVSYLLKDYKYDELIKLFEYNDNNKKMCIRVNTLKTSDEEVLSKLESIGITSEKAKIGMHSYQVSETVIGTDLFKEGLITVQDMASQYVSEVLEPSKDSLVLDMCASPGSKSAHMSAIMENTGTIYACDIYKHKIKLMEENFKRLGVTNVKCQLVDARKVKDFVKRGSLDYILADMPCSGLGVMGHKIDLKYNINMESINEIIALQKEILDSAYPILKKGGTLVVSTCTINKSENEEQIKEFVKRHPQMKVKFMKTFMPYEYDCDGFFICKLVKEL